ncbi:MAG: bifunctional adenosylcobinamide kinase/adenosylcobinamide-phosphate guanylyltransferase, partial [Lachnospiraceae bacterium]|nr:bifunctional adenosylcobinamide kinase/adenosylcobinamide-phosphate guanylyltransferase [Lachnospiraceae bacterium]
LKAQTTHLIVVTNNIFEDGIVYEEAPMEYIRAMGELNRRLADLADQVVEVVAGIPVVIK